MCSQFHRNQKTFIDFKFWWYDTGIINVINDGKYFIIANARFISSKKWKWLEICKKYFVFLWIQQTLFWLPCKISDQNKQEKKKLPESNKICEYISVCGIFEKQILSIKAF